MLWTVGSVPTLTVFYRNEEVVGKGQTGRKGAKMFTLALWRRFGLIILTLFLYIS